MLDIHNAIDRSIRAEVYVGGDGPQNNGTAWRVFGPDADGDRELGIGIEAWRAANRSCWITLCTVMIV